MAEQTILDRPNELDVIKSSAATVIRAAVREGLLNGFAGTHGAADVIIDMLQDSVCVELARKSNAWAMAVLAGVQMAPDLIKEVSGG